MGKRQIGKLQPIDLIVTILISNISVKPIEDKDSSLFLGLLPILILVILELLFSALSLKIHFFRKLITGKPKFIIKNGKINQKEMVKLRISIDDLLAGLRKKNIFNLNEVHDALIETNGSISVFKNKNAESSFQLPIIYDGVILNNNLKFLNISSNLLNEFLAKQKLSARNIFLMMADSNFKIYVSLMNK